MNIPFIAFISIFVLIFFLRIPIPLGFVTAVSVYCLLKGLPLAFVAEKIVTNMFSSYILIAVPLFIFAAQVMNTGKVTDKIFYFANAIIGRRSGALGHVNVLASLIFSGMTGSALADASGLGLMEIESMRKQGYDDGFSCAITAASATIGPIFPPSIPMIMYSMLSGASIGALFLGGIVPGLLIAFALMIYVSIIAKRRKYPKGEVITLKQFISSTIDAIPALLTPVILLGGIYSGIVTPTEAGAIAALYGLIISVLFYRSINLKSLGKIIFETVKSTGTISIIVACSFGMSFVVAYERIPDVVAAALLGITTNKYVFLLLVNIAFLVLGMFIDVNTITLVFIPIVLPMVKSLGIDLVHFGVVIVLNMMIGLSTPPYGGLLFVTSGISKTPLGTIIKEILPMVGVLILVLFIITYIPGFVMYIPNLLVK
ncbi:MAG: TRAP transporter large permease [Spirochaetales bacterium]